MQEQIINIQQGYELSMLQGSMDDTCIVILLTELATNRQWVLKHIFSEHEYPESMNDEDTVFLNCYHFVTYIMDKIEKKGIIDLRHWYTEHFWTEEIYPKTSFRHYVSTSLIKRFVYRSMITYLCPVLYKMGMYSMSPHSLGVTRCAYQ